MFQGVQCPVCCEVATDDADGSCPSAQSQGWSALTGCGHVFHTACLLQCLEHKSLCPNCRVRERDWRDWRTRGRERVGGREIDRNALEGRFARFVLQKKRLNLEQLKKK
jgi:Zinc finger, C3HC4 type (RING finger)